ncbi:MAG: tRNA lysidine(34) synthetase [Halothermotrichaceae bacterium]
MKLSLPKSYNQKIVKAMAEFNLVEAGDRIVVGLSGGKDSSFLLYALSVLQKHLAVNFELAALTIDLGFDKSDYNYLKYLCKSLDVPYYIEETEISRYILNENINNPCAKCAHFRKGAITKFMKANNFTKVAYGHHYDDAVETYLMSILYSGQMLALQPKRYLSDNDVYIIRPLIYLREKRIIEMKDHINYQENNNPCPYDEKSKRAEIKSYLEELIDNKQVFYNLASAMREDAPFELWPEKLTGEEIKVKMNDLWSFR